MFAASAGMPLSAVTVTRASPGSTLASTVPIWGALLRANAWTALLSAIFASVAASEIPSAPAPTTKAPDASYTLLSRLSW